MAVTPIQQKLSNQRQAKNSIDGFVRAKAVLKKDVDNVNNVKGDVINQNQEHCAARKNFSTQVTSSTVSNDGPLCELDDDFLSMIWEELDQNVSVPILEVIKTELAGENNGKTSVDNIWLKNLNLNIDSNKEGQHRERVKNDFDECSDSSSDKLDVSYSTSSLVNEMRNKRESFFSITDPEDDLEKEPTVQKTSMQKKGTKIVQKPAIETDAMMISQTFSRAPIHSGHHAAEQNESLNLQPFDSRLLNSLYLNLPTQISSISNQATCATSENGEQSSEMGKVDAVPKTPSVNKFKFVQPRQIQPPANGSNRYSSQQRADFLALGSPERKKPKLIEELLVNAERQSNAHEPPGLRL